MIFLLVFPELEKLLFGKFHKPNSQAMQNEADGDSSEESLKKNQTENKVGVGGWRNQL